MDYGGLSQQWDITKSSQDCVASSKDAKALEAKVTVQPQCTGQWKAVHRLFSSADELVSLLRVGIATQRSGERPVGPSAMQAATMMEGNMEDSGRLWGWRQSSDSRQHQHDKSVSDMFLHVVKLETGVGGVGVY